MERTEWQRRYAEALVELGHDCEFAADAAAEAIEADGKEPYFSPTIAAQIDASHWA